MVTKLDEVKDNFSLPDINIQIINPQKTTHSEQAKTCSGWPLNAEFQMAIGRSETDRAKQLERIPESSEILQKLDIEIQQIADLALDFQTTKSIDTREQALFTISQMDQKYSEIGFEKMYLNSLFSDYDVKEIEEIALMKEVTINKIVNTAVFSNEIKENINSNKTEIFGFIRLMSTLACEDGKAVA